MGKNNTTGNVANSSYTERWLKTASQEFAGALDYAEEKQGSNAAKKLAKIINTSVASIVNNPGIGREGMVSGTRVFFVPRTKFLIPYRVKGSEVQILRIFHTSRKPPKQGW